MDAAQIVEAVWVAGAMVLVLAILVTRRARKHGGAYQAGVVGALYEWQNKDKQRALDVIVEGRAAARRPEYPDDTLPDGDRPADARSRSTGRSQD
jgi:hypothetical protein